MLTSLWKDFWAVMGQLCCPQPSGSPAFIWQGSAEAFAQPRAPQSMLQRATLYSAQYIGQDAIWRGWLSTWLLPYGAAKGPRV